MKKKESIQDLVDIEINGNRQWILVRGNSFQNPLVLFLHGGPGFSQMFFAPTFHKSLEKRFLVVNWDQRASGKLFSKYIDKIGFTLEMYIEDTIEVTKLLLKKYKKQKLFLVGHSWGCILGMFAIQRNPNLYEAFIGTGFGVNFQVGEELSIQYLKKKATEAGDVKVQKSLEMIKFPITEGTFKHYIDLKSKLINKYGGYFYTNPLQLLLKALPKILISNTYRLRDYIKMIQGIKYGKEIGKHSLLSLDLFKQIPEVAAPVYFFIGRHDYHTTFELAAQYYKVLIAPKKGWIWFEQSAHSPLFEESEVFCNKLIEITNPYIVSK